jgi:hypothetical protein
LYYIKYFNLKNAVIFENVLIFGILLTNNNDEILSLQVSLLETAISTFKWGTAPVKKIRLQILMLNTVFLGKSQSYTHFLINCERFNVWTSYKVN